MDLQNGNIAQQAGRGSGMMRAPGIVQSAVIKKELRVRMRGWRWAGITTRYLRRLGGSARGQVRRPLRLINELACPVHGRWRLGRLLICVTGLAYRRTRRRSVDLIPRSADFYGRCFCN